MTFYFLPFPRPPTSTLFPYTTLCRSRPGNRPGIRRPLPPKRRRRRRASRPFASICRARRLEEHTSELQSPDHLVCRLLREKKKRDGRGILFCRGVFGRDLQQGVAAGR